MLQVLNLPCQFLFVCVRVCVKHRKIISVGKYCVLLTSFLLFNDIWTLKWNWKFFRTARANIYSKQPPLDILPPCEAKFRHHPALKLAAALGILPNASSQQLPARHVHCVHFCSCYCAWRDPLYLRAWNSRVAFPLARQRTGLRGGLREKLCFHVATLHTDTALWEQQTCRRDFFPTSTTPSLCTNTFSAFHRPYGEVFPSTHARGSERTNWNTCTADKFRCPILKLLLCDWILEFPVVAVLVSMAQWTPLSVPHP